MSWESQIDELTGTGKVTAAAFYGHDGAILATSPGVSVGIPEIKKLVAAFDNDSEATSNGLFLEQTKFLYVSNKDGLLHVRDGTSGAVCVLTKKSLLIGFYQNDEVDNCIEAVKKTGESLRALGN
ncbi:hypothetical protein BGZ80_006064 [Entomortierella chlamydospora]|uniref:Profilin n=1 Tax=Entomortierella chlamydospora TaxID=101097 RepID=A0A9P6T4U5_9FUNG|nr:hypothetical protein BGZ79_009222 [Entomortierella chlamydospora]KAG0024791.1 hypothetical protein BGZ80_006064 [Entomortierella chlamydospora]